MGDLGPSSPQRFSRYGGDAVLVTVYDPTGNSNWITGERWTHASETKTGDTSSSQFCPHTRGPRGDSVHLLHVRRLARWVIRSAGGRVASWPGRRASLSLSHTHTHIPWTGSLCHVYPFGAFVVRYSRNWDFISTRTGTEPGGTGPIPLHYLRGGLIACPCPRPHASQTCKCDERQVIWVIANVQGSLGDDRPCRPPASLSRRTPWEGAISRVERPGVKGGRSSRGTGSSPPRNAGHRYVKLSGRLRVCRRTENGPRQMRRADPLPSAVFVAIELESALDSRRLFGPFA
jgi:hypothetical protein